MGGDLKGEAQVPRIYALAKELKVDSKELVDICTKAGVTGKGSALASLSDEEVGKVKAYLGGGNKPTAAPPARTAERAPAKTGATARSRFTRDDYIAPGGTTGKPKTITSTPTKKASPEKKSDESRPIVRKGPVVKLAAMPTVDDASPPPQVEEVKAQAPELRLPPDAIRGAKTGAKAPLEQFTKQEKKRRQTGTDAPAAEAAPKVGPEGVPLAKDAGRGRRRGKTPVATPEGGGRLAGMAASRSTRQLNRKTRRPTTRDDDERDAGTGRRSGRHSRQSTNTAAPRREQVVLQLPCTVRSFSESTGVPNIDILRILMGIGQMANINTQLDAETAELLATELEVGIEFRQEETLEDAVLTEIRQPEADESLLVPRPPIITFLGHVDHGKTSLLDKIIGTHVVDGEAGGITQHIRAYTIEQDDRRISFVDTPGHEAFTEMRARGANVTDIAVLVIAADDGVMPQTIEAISHARAAEVPIVVALNKMDLPGADVNKAMQDLSTNELLPSEWGGDVEVVKTSAESGEGIDDLLETLLLTADLHEYKANPNRSAYGTCLEAEQESGRGVVAKVMVQAGTLHVGDILVCGDSFGRVKAMFDTLQPTKKVLEAGPSTPVNLTGLNTPPEAGEAFYVLDDIAQAREIARQRGDRSRQQSLGVHSSRISFEDFQLRLEEGRLDTTDEVVNLNLILRADFQGSIEAIEKELSKLDHPEVAIKILQRSVGGVTVADVTLAHASGAVIVGFNVIPDEAARSLADERGVEIRRYDIIYKVAEDIKALLEGKLKPEERVKDLGRVLVKQVFSVSRVGKIAGCHVVKGNIERGCRIRVNREGRGIGDYSLDSLRREKDDVREVREGFECGIKLTGFNDFKEGDILEAYKIVEVARTL